MRRFLWGLMIALGTIIGILWVLFYIREQEYTQRFADYTQYSSAAELEAYLSQKLEVGQATENDVVAFIVQSGISPKISPDANCGRGQGRAIVIICTVRAPATDYSNEFWMNQIKNLMFDYYVIRFEFVDGILKEISLNLEHRML